MENNNWESWSNYVLKELERSNSNYEKLASEVALINKNMATDNLKNNVAISKLEIRASIWGGLSGVITVLAIILLKYIN